MGRMAMRLAPLLLLSSLGACVAPGLIYTNITVPLDVDLLETVDPPARGESDLRIVSFYVSVMWDSAAIADAARQRGLTELHYADMEITSVWFGIWQQRKVIVYGL